MKIAAVFFTVAALGLTAIPTRSYAGAGIYGVGANSCGKWTEARKADDKETYLIYLSWVEGFVTGVIGATSFHYAPTDGSGIAAELDNHCAEHPMDSLAAASVYVVVKLRAASQ